MIPLRDVIPSRTTPIVTMTLIALNALVFLYELTLGDLVTDFVFTFGLVPARFSWAAVLTAMFVHGSFLHVAGNMLYLWLFGDNVEDRMGHGRFAAFYLLCGASAGLVQTFLYPDSFAPMIGTSGAIAGVMGAYFLLFPRSQIVMLVPIVFFVQIMEVPAIAFLGVWFLLQLVNGLGSLAGATADPAGGIGFWAHIVGFAAGICSIAIFRRPERLRVEWWNDV